MFAKHKIERLGFGKYSLVSYDMLSSVCQLIAYDNIYDTFPFWGNGQGGGEGRGSPWCPFCLSIKLRDYNVLGSMRNTVHILSYRFYLLSSIKLKY